MLAAGGRRFPANWSLDLPRFRHNAGKNWLFWRRNRSSSRALDLRSAELIAAVAEIGSSASADIRAAIENAMLLQQRSIWFLILTLGGGIRRGPR